MAIATAAKRVSFKAPYSGTTFQAQTGDILGREGYLSGGETSDNGSTITVQPFTIVQRGIVAESNAAVTGITVPTGSEPWFILGAIPDDDPDSGVVVTVSRSLPAANGGVVIAFKANGEWRNPLPVHVEGASRQSKSSEIGYEDGFKAFETIDVSRDVDQVVLDTGRVVDPDGLRRIIPRQSGDSARIDEFTPLRAHPNRDRVDYLVLRQREPHSPEVVEVTGGIADGNTPHVTVSKGGANTRIGYYAKRGGTNDEQWYAWGDGNDVHVQGGPAGGGFADGVLLTGGGAIGATWIAGQRESDDALILVYLDGIALRVTSFDASTGASIDAPVTIDTQTNALSHVRAVLDANETLHIVYEHDEGALQQVYYTRVDVPGGAGFGAHALTPRIVNGSDTGKNDTWPDLAIDRLGKVHIVYTTNAGAFDYGDFVYAVYSAEGTLDSITTYLASSQVGFQAAADDDLGFVARSYDELHRARVAVTPHDEVYASLFGMPSAGAGAGNVSNALMFSPSFSERLGYPIVNIDDGIALGDYVAGDILANETGDLRVFAASVDSGGTANWREQAFAIDTVFAPNGKIGSSNMFTLLWSTLPTPSNFDDQSRDGALFSGPAGEMVACTDISTGGNARGIGRWPDAASSGQRRPTPHAKDVYLAGYFVPASSGAVTTDDGVFRVFNTRPKKLNFPFLVGDRGGEFNGFDGIQEALRAAARESGTVIVRPGKYHFGGRTWRDGTLSLASGVSLIGEGSVYMTGVSIATGFGATQTVAAISGSIVETAVAVPREQLRPGDFIIFNTGTIHRVTAILPPVSGGNQGRYLVDATRAGAAPAGSETSFEVYQAGVRIEGISVDGTIDLDHLWAPVVRGCRFRTTISAPTRVILCTDVYYSTLENLDFSECEVTGAGGYVELAASEGTTLRNIRVRDTAAKILVGNTAENVTLDNITGDSSDDSIEHYTIDPGRTTPVSVINVGSFQWSDDIEKTVVGTIVAPYERAIEFFDWNLLNNPSPPIPLSSSASDGGSLQSGHGSILENLREGTNVRTAKDIAGIISGCEPTPGVFPDVSFDTGFTFANGRVANPGVTNNNAATVGSTTYYYWFDEDGALVRTTTSPFPNNLNSRALALKATTNVGNTDWDSFIDMRRFVNQDDWKGPVIVRDGDGTDESPTHHRSLAGALEWLKEGRLRSPQAEIIITEQLQEDVFPIVVDFSGANIRSLVIRGLGDNAGIRAEITSATDLFQFIGLASKNAATGDGQKASLRIHNLLIDNRQTATPVTTGEASIRLDDGYFTDVVIDDVRTMSQGGAVDHFLKVDSTVTVDKLTVAGNVIDDCAGTNIDLSEGTVEDARVFHNECHNDGSAIAGAYGIDVGASVVRAWVCENYVNRGRGASDQPFEHGIRVVPRLLSDSGQDQGGRWIMDNVISGRDTAGIDTAIKVINNTGGTDEASLLISGNQISEGWATGIELDITVIGARIIDNFIEGFTVSGIRVVGGGDEIVAENHVESDEAFSSSEEMIFANDGRVSIVDNTVLYPNSVGGGYAAGIVVEDGSGTAGRPTVSGNKVIGAGSGIRCVQERMVITDNSISVTANDSAAGTAIKVGPTLGSRDKAVVSGNVIFCDYIGIDVDDSFAEASIVNNMVAVAFAGTGNSGAHALELNGPRCVVSGNIFQMEDQTAASLFSSVVLINTNSGEIVFVGNRVKAYTGADYSGSSTGQNAVKVNAANCVVVGNYLENRGGNADKATFKTISGATGVIFGGNVIRNTHTTTPTYVDVGEPTEYGEESVSFVSSFNQAVT